MSKPRPPKPANDHMAPMAAPLATADHDLTDEELDARIAAAQAAQRRASKLALLRITRASVAELCPELEWEGPD